MLSFLFGNSFHLRAKACHLYLFWKDKSIRIAFPFYSFSWQLFTFLGICIEFKANILLRMVAASAPVPLPMQKWNCNKLFCVYFGCLKAYLLGGLKWLCQTDCQVRIVVQVFENFFHMKLLMLLLLLLSLMLSLSLSLSLSSITTCHMETEIERRCDSQSKKLRNLCCISVQFSFHVTFCYWKVSLSLCCCYGCSSSSQCCCCSCCCCITDNTLMWWQIQELILFDFGL